MSTLRWKPGSITAKLILITTLPIGLIVLGGVMALVNGSRALKAADEADRTAHAAEYAIEVLDQLAKEEVVFSVDVAEVGPGADLPSMNELDKSLERLIGEVRALDLPAARVEPLVRIREELPVLRERLRDDLSQDTGMARRHADMVDSVAGIAATLIRRAGVSGIGEGSSDALAVLPLWSGFFSENRAMTTYVASGDRSDRADAEPAIRGFERDLAAANADGLVSAPIELSNATYDGVRAQVVDGVGLGEPTSLEDWQVAQVDRADQLSDQITMRVEDYAASVHAAHEREMQRTIFMMAAVFITVVVTITLMVQFARQLSRRLERLDRDAEAVVAGNFEGVHAGDGTDEIDKVHDAFARVAVQLSRFGTEAKRISAAVARDHSVARVDESGYEGEWLELVRGLNAVNDTHAESTARAERSWRRQQNLQRLTESFAKGLFASPVFDGTGREVMEAVGAKQFEYWEYTRGDTLTLRFAASNLPSPGSDPVRTSVDRNGFDPLAKRGLRFADCISAQVYAGQEPMGLAIWYEADDDPEAQLVADSIAALIGTPNIDSPDGTQDYRRARDHRSGLPTLEALQKELECRIETYTYGGSDAMVIRFVLTASVDEERLEVLADEAILAAAVAYLSELMPGAMIAHVGELDFIAVGSDSQKRQVSEQLERDLVSGQVVLADHVMRVAVGVVPLSSVEQPSAGAVIIATRHACRASHESRRICHYSGEIGRTATEESELRSQLVHAVTEGDMTGFFVEFQPELDLRSGAIVAVESLARWDAAGLGRQAPDKFIRVAEEMDVISGLNRQLMRMAMHEFMRIGPPGCKLAINASARDLKPGIADSVVAMAAEVGLPLSTLEVELTETAMIEEEAASLGELERLRDLGCGITIDDFGSGYASIGYLTRFPLTKLKIDRVFVTDCDKRSDAAAVIRHIVDLAHDLGLVVVAEGVETAGELELIVDAGCDVAQGYLLSRPVRPDELGSAALRSGEAISNVIDIRA